ncbi:MAG: TonB-dependent receptor domain-containing protein [Sphingomonadales bacterium]
MTAAATAALTPTAVAQQTTSVINGSVVTSVGQAVANARVVVVDSRTNQRRTFTTNSQGRFVARGLRVGGPYTVTLEGSADYESFSQENVFLELAETTPVFLVARAEGVVEEIVVTGRQSDTQIQMGAGSLFGSDNINAQANVGRDFKNIIRQNPRVSIDLTNSNAVSIGGGNNRFNSLTIDGVRQNDDFGLNNSGLPTQRTPVSLDAIEQIGVEVAPFDVTFGSFQGGTINIVTKSGTNEFHGSGFFHFSNEGLTGNSTGDIDARLGNFTEKSFGGTLSGPIIKDKLFFFASYEKFSASDTSGLDFGPAGSGRANEIDSVTQADIDRVLDIANRVYGFDALPLPTSGSTVTDKKFLAKIDWNISELHTLTATYQYVKGNDLVPQGNRRGRRIGLPSNWYNKTEKLQSLSTQIFSDWTDAFSTEFKFALKKVDTFQESLGGTDFAQMTIDTPGGGEIRIGPDFFRHGNRLANDQVQVKFKGDYLWREHLFTAGYERDTLDIFNLFTPGSEGDYNFDSIDDFENRIASSLFYQNAFTNDENDAAANFDFTINSAYGQDKWEPTDSLTIMAGFRYDWYTGSDAPELNQNFVDRHGFSNQETLDGRSIFMPRFGFNYLVDERTVVRGGAGLFSGGTPNVWLSNSFSNDGVTFTVAGDDGNNPQCAGIMSSAAALTNVDGFNVAQEVQDCMFSGNGNVNAVDPDFDIPSNWKFNLALEHDFDFGPLGEDWHVTVEAIWSRVKDAVDWRELRRVQVGTASDGRPIFDTIDTNGFDLLLTNTSKGKSDSYSVAVDKTFEDRFAGETYFSASYTYSDVEDVNPGESSTATSNFGKPAASDRNNKPLGTSDFEIRHRVTGSLSYKKAFFGDNNTTISFFLETRSGKPFSYTFDNNNRDTSVFGGDREFVRRDSQLLYVPTGANDPNVTFAPGFDQAAFFAFVESSGLSKFAGQISEKNAFRSPWRTRVDMRFVQEIHMPSLPVFGGNKFEFFFDMENLANFLNNDWGRVEQVSFPFTAPIVRASTDANGKLVFESFNAGRAAPRVSTLPSLWKVQLGVRFAF